MKTTEINLLSPEELKDFQLWSNKNNGSVKFVTIKSSTRPWNDTNHPLNDICAKIPKNWIFTLTGAGISTHFPHRTLNAVFFTKENIVLYANNCIPIKNNE